MFFSKHILSLLSLVLLASVKTAHGDGTADEACLNEMAAYQACAISSQTCDSECEDVNQNPEFTEEEIAEMITDPNFMCKWFNKVFCAIQQCCDACNDKADAYFSCLAAQSTDDGTCEFACTDNGSGNGGAVDDGNDTADDGSDNGGTVNDGSNNGGTGSSGNSSGSSSLSTMAWASVVVAAGYGLI